MLLRSLRLLPILALSAGPFHTFAQATREPAESDEDLPVAEWPTEMAGLDAATRDLGRGKGSRNRLLMAGPPIEPSDSDSLTTIITHDPPSLLPIDDSDTIVTGEVLSANAILSADQRKLHSEFSFHVEEVHYSRVSLAADTVVTLVRNGGRGRLPSGRIFRLRVSHKRMPLAGDRYLLFLKSDQLSQTFYIHSGYRLREGAAQLLDDYAHLAQYNGILESDLLAHLYAELAAAAEKEGR